MLGKPDNRGRIQLVLLAVILVGCGSQPPPNDFTFPPPRSQAPIQSAETAAVEVIPCAEVGSVEGPTPEYTAEAPEPPDIPGAGGPDEEKPNEEAPPVTPIDPDAVIEADEDLPRTVIPPSGAQGEPEPEDVEILRPPASVPKALHIAEPDIAVHGDVSLMTWNYGAARSFDGGATIQYMNPFKMMNGADGVAVDGGFCCDQLAHYLPTHDLWLWVLQTKTKRSGHQGNNRLRLAVAKGTGEFTTHRDFLPLEVPGLPDDAWFDFPKIGSTDSYVFLTTNVFRPDESFVTAVVYRIAIADLAAGRPTTPSCFTTLTHLNGYQNPIFTVVPVRHATGAMYLGAHYSNSTLAVWRWPDGAATATFHKVLDAAYPNPIRRDPDGVDRFDYHCLPTEGTVSTRHDWCQRADDRISSAWVTRGRVGFAWNVGQDPANDWPYPSVWVRILDESMIASCERGGCIVDKPSIRSTETAFQYAAISPNSRGDLGVVVQYGGGAFPLSCNVGARDAFTPADMTWEFRKKPIAFSDMNPLAPESGDYLGISEGPTDGTWAGACGALRSANGQEFPSSVYFPNFGRRFDTPTL